MGWVGPLSGKPVPREHAGNLRPGGRLNPGGIVATGCLRKPSLEDPSMRPGRALLEAKLGGPPQQAWPGADVKQVD